MVFSWFLTINRARDDLGGMESGRATVLYEASG